MVLNFPDPNDAQEYTSPDGVVYRWDGVKWESEYGIPPKGEPGEPGESIVFDDLSAAQKEEIKGQKGEQGQQGPGGSGSQGQKGEPGVASTSANLVRWTQSDASAIQYMAFAGTGSISNNNYYPVQYGAGVYVIAAGRRIHADQFRTPSNTYVRSNTEPTFGFYAPNYFVTGATSSEFSALATDLNFDVNTWNEISVQQRGTDAVIPAAELEGTSFEHLLGPSVNNRTGDTEDDRGVNYVGLIPLLVETVQKLNSRIAALEALQ